MSFLSLARGDFAARQLLQRAIKARFGPRPVLLDSLRLTLSGSSKGPFGLPASIKIILAYKGIDHWLWRQERSVLRIFKSIQAEGFDGKIVYTANGSKVTPSSEEQLVQGMRLRVWAGRAVHLTTLTQEEVTLRNVDDHTFTAEHSGVPGSAVTIRLASDDSVEYLTMNRYNPGQGRAMPYFIRPSRELNDFNGLLVPGSVTYQWENQPPTTFTVTSAELNPTIADTAFRLETP